MKPIGNFSTSMKKQIEIEGINEDKVVHMFAIETETPYISSPKENIAKTLNLSQVQESFLARATK